MKKAVFLETVVAMLMGLAVFGLFDTNASIADISVADEAGSSSVSIVITMHAVANE
jgi:hypothetical protein